MKNKFSIILILIISTFAFSSFVSHKKQAKDDVFTVVLDAGHGGHDPGKVASDGKSKYNEKDVALKIVLLVGKELEKNPNINVVYTRKTDVFVNLYKRGEIANKAKADLFISIHCNAHSSQAYGSETYVLGLHANKRNFDVAKAENEVIYLEDDHEVNYAKYDINSPESFIGLEIEQEEFLDQSILLAAAIQENFKINLERKSRGVKQAGFIVLHQTYMPSVLIETGFITNKSERNYLLSSNGQKELSRNIVSAVMKYKSYIDENVGDEIEGEIINDILEEETNEVSLPEKRSEVAIITSEAYNEENIVVTNSTPETNSLKKNIVFKVQIAAGSTKIELKPYNFNGLDPISSENSDDLYRYFYGNPENYTEALVFKEKARQAGYSTSYVVAYEDGKRITLTEALMKD